MARVRVDRQPPGPLLKPPRPLQGGHHRGVAQFGSAFALGATGHPFKSDHPDHFHEAMVKW